MDSKLNTYWNFILQLSLKVFPVSEITKTLEKTEKSGFLKPGFSASGKKCGHEQGL